MLHKVSIFVLLTLSATRYCYSIDPLNICFFFPKFAVIVLRSIVPLQLKSVFSNIKKIGRYFNQLILTNCY